MRFTFKRAFLSAVLLSSLLYLSGPNLAHAEDKKVEVPSEQTINNGAVAEPPSGPNVDINTEVEKVEIDTPASVTGEIVQGTGTVIDFSTSGSKAFYTIKDSEQKVFHLIIDMDKTDNNVYFLTDVNKSDLVIQNQVVQKEDNIPPPVTVPMEPEQTKESGNGSFLILILIGAIIVIAVYYFRVIKKKQGKDDSSEEDMDENYDDEDVLVTEDDKQDK